MENRVKKIPTKSLLLLMLFTFIGVLTRFYNLNWGAPYYFHPDERNIASSISQLSFPDQMNPHFFAYGSLPIYTAYFSGTVVNSVTCQLSAVNCQLSTVSFEQAILISRWYSALFSILLIPLLYLLGKKLHSVRTGIIASFLGMTSVGFTQYAHFGTFEMWLTFFSALLFWLSLSLLKNPTIVKIIFSGITLGILIGVKVSSIVLIPLPIFAYFLHKKNLHRHHTFLSLTAHAFRTTLMTTNITLIAVIVYLASNPYVFLADPAIQSVINLKGMHAFITAPEILLGSQDFQSSMGYESSVALGSLPVFYTQAFKDTLPILYHFLHVYPFLLNPVMTLLFIVSFIYLVYYAFQKKEKTYMLLVLSYLILFLSQAFFYVKWIRYMVSTLPFVYLSIAIFGSSMVKNWQQHTNIKNIVVATIALVCGVYLFSYVTTVLIPQDTRIAAKNWAQQHLSKTATVLSESYDMGIVPFNEAFSKITLCNIYDLEIHEYICSDTRFTSTLAASDLIILPSQRLLQSRMQDRKTYPKGNTYYRELFFNTGKYRLAYSTPCDIFCRILYLGDPIRAFEQTASVFDRPMVFIIEKQK